MTTRVKVCCVSSIEEAAVAIRAGASALGLVSAIPVFLAGGIDAANVAEARHRVRPYGIDLCTGVRTDGRLDAAKLYALVSALNATDAGGH